MSAPIGTVNELVSVIRSRLGAAERVTARPAAGQSASGRRFTDRGITALIETRVRQIGREDPQRGRKALRVFLEVVLLNYLGEQLMHDPRFYQLLDDVQGALESDPSSAALVKQAVEHLLS
jgi:hypothetical protein